MHIATAIAILVGCAIMVWSTIRALRLRPYLAAPQYLRAWRIASALVGLFTIGYAAAAALVWFGADSVLVPLMGAVFLGGAVFIHVITNAATSLVSEVLTTRDQNPHRRRAVTQGPNPSAARATDDDADPTKATAEPPDGPVARTSPRELAAQADAGPRTPKFVDPDGTLRTQFPAKKKRDSRVRRYSGTFRMDESATHVDASPTPATILVVEDSHINRTILDSYLDRLGHRGILIGDGKSALSVLETNNSIELVLLDYWLPDMEGLEILQKMRASKLHKDTPVLMLSSEDDSETIARCIEAGAADFLSKPFAPRLLQARIDACLTKGRFRARELQFMARLENERKRSDELLRVILPTPIAKELTETNRVKPRRYEDVAVMFADISGFTAYCDKQRPEHVLSHLQSIVIAFEQLAEQYRVQKIKTIGDSFMAASGLLDEVDDPVLRCVELGMEMIKVVERAVPEWNLRVGVHIGPVVAGIVGRSQFLFDIWGDTVNTASRIETSTEENTICVSARAWEQIKDQVVGESIGLVHAKGKGDLELFRVDGLRAIPSVAVDELPEHKRGGYTVH